MASSLIGGMINNGHAADRICVFDPSADRVAELVAQYGIVSTPSNAALIERCDTVVIAVKPQVLEQVLTPLKQDIAQHQPLIISVVAGITAASINQWLQGEFAIIRVMPNTPALVGAGASGMYATAQTTLAQQALAETLLSAVGLAVWVPNETDIDSVTALSGSGPAYFMLFIKALVNAGVQAGLDRETAKTLAVATARGSAELIQSSEVDLQTLIDNVTSPKGTTERALQAFAQHGLESTVQAAFDAAKQRSAELAEELG